MPGVRVGTRLILAGIAFLAMQPVAHAQDASNCITVKTNDQDRAGFLEIARTLVRPWRVTPETFSYCTSKGLFWDSDGARVETQRLKQRDGTQKYFVVSCERKHLKPPWSCNSVEQRSMQVVINTPDGEKAHEAQLTMEIDAKIARDLLISSFRIASGPPQDIPLCGVHPVEWNGAIPQRLAESWNESNYLRVSSWNNRYSVTRGWTLLEYSKADRPGGPPVFRCWGDTDKIIER